MKRWRVRLLGLLAAAALLGLLAAGCGGGGEERVVTLMAHDAFNISEEVIQQFEEENDAQVKLVLIGDAGSTLNAAILNKGDPLGDLLFGVDNTLLGRALDEEIFVPYESPALATVDPRFLIDPEQRVTPVDFGFVNLNYDIAALQEAGLEPPQDLRALTGPEWKGKLVVENPATSSPGLNFLITTVAVFGEEGEYTYLDFWRDLRKNDVLVVDGWTEAYFTHFSQYGGDRPLVVSYTTSPAAEVYFSEGKLTEPPTGNIAPPGQFFLQVETVGILRNAKHVELAQKFIDFMLSRTFQEDIPSNMFVYPVLQGAGLPDFFIQWAPVPDAQPAQVEPATIAAKRDEWIQKWTEVVLR